MPYMQKGNRVKFTHSDDELFDQEGKLEEDFDSTTDYVKVRCNNVTVVRNISSLLDLDC